MMQERFSDPEFRFRALKIVVILAVVFGLFFPEMKYFAVLSWEVGKNLFQQNETLLPLTFIPAEFGNNVFKIFLGGVIYFVFLRLSVFFNSQFLLPVYTWNERLHANDLLLHFLRGDHGPLIFVRDGEMIAHYGEAEKRGHGVLLINSNSAVVVGGKVFGPGIVFTEGRSIDFVFDLRKQVRSKPKVRAVTRDGIEIESNVSVQFSVSAPPEIVYVTLIDGRVHVLELDERGDLILGFSADDFDNDEQLEIRRNIEKLKADNDIGLVFADVERYNISRFSPERIQAAYSNQPRRPSDGKKIDWRELPLTIAVEEFRNTIVRYPYDDLFPNPQDQNAITLNDFPLNWIREEFSRNVRNASYLAYSYVERVDFEPLQPGEDRLTDLNTMIYDPVQLLYPRPLRQSAISVTAVGFGEIVPTSDEVKLQTIKNLVARWESVASRTGIGFDEQAALIRSRAKAQVQQDTVYALAEFLQNSDRARTALILRVFQALEAAASDSTNKDTVSMVNMLREMREWFMETSDFEFNGLEEDKGDG